MLALTIDIEDWYHIPSVTGSTFSRFKDVDEFFATWKGRYDYLTQPTRRVLEILEELNIRATFFVVADVTEHYPGLVQQIAKRGHEIACHGLHHACKVSPKTKKPLMPQSKFEERARQAKQMLERETGGQEIIGYRAPATYVAGWMLDSLEKIGFRYDSSICINSFYNKTGSSLKGVDTRPYYPRESSLEPGDKRGILELPLSHFKLGFKFPTGGGPMLRFLGARYIMLGLKQSLKRGDTVVYFHPIDISDEKFPSCFSMQRPFYWAVKGKVVERRIRYLLANTDTHIGSIRDMLKQAGDKVGN